MSDIAKLTGIVLSEHLIGENDKSLTVLTKERGKVQIMSQRSRRQNHKLFAASQPFVYGEFVVTFTRNYIYLNSAECKDTFGDIKRELDDICYATYFAEIAEYCTVEMQDERNILNLLYVTFLAMRKKLMSYPLMKSVYEYKILQYTGIGLSVFGCLNCGKSDDLSMLSFENGGVFCSECGKQIHGSQIKPSVLYTLQYLASIPLNKLYSFRLKPELETEVRWIIHRFFKMHVGHQFKSEKMLEIIC